ncbi:hypothetical protein FOPG_19786 [Fusarium oxysporum f. sp. conglutinans race 2 54008]|uniref:Uncharacterized protein n=1 Tax=Fusarium oxysporum f. sp. conglutinans race 2 54008 TaxID=1089457 RepID=X0HRY7_FUSOX|nr:hypothetical protein FOPG_19786 [Fusarium oxysporum f. sp. conglutinans race 2 54008]
MTSLRSTSDPNSEKQSIAKKASSCLQAFADLLEKLQTQAEVGPGSLDDGLQLAANTYRVVLDLLDNLEELLCEAKDILDGKKIFWDRELSHLSESDDDDGARTRFKGLENEFHLSQINECIVSNVDNLQGLNKSIEWGIAKRGLAMLGP